MDGDEEEKPCGQPVDDAEIRLLEQLRDYPEVLSHVQVILDIASNIGDPYKTADEVGTLLIQEVRQLGNATMKEWATQAGKRVSSEFKAEDTIVLQS